jgi:hypothetical protein
MCWALACGSSPLADPLPFFYPAFFLVMIVHRVGRDERRWGGLCKSNPVVDP